MLFHEIVEATDRLSPEEPEILVTNLRRRSAERGRKRLVEDIRKARREFAAGRCAPATVDELMKGILGDNS